MSRRRLLAICFVWVCRCRGSFSPLLKPSLNTLASRRGGVSRYSYCKDYPVSGRLRRSRLFHRPPQKKTAPSKGQAWRLNRSSCNSANFNLRLSDDQALERVSPVPSVRVEWRAQKTVLRSAMQQLPPPRVYDHTTTTMQDNEYTPPSSPHKPAYYY